MPFDYVRWREDARVPIECSVNVMMMYKELRRVVQVDVTYYCCYPPTTMSAVEEMVASLSEDEVVRRTDHSGNIVLYLSKNRESVERQLRSWSLDGTVEGGFQSVQFSRLLDPHFYVATAPLETVLAHTHLYRVSVDVIYDGRAGALLVQMLFPTMLDHHVSSLFRRFHALKARIQDVDPLVHCSLTMYTKTGDWRTGPEYAPRSLARLD